MGIRFRKRVKILPGVHLNFSNTGVSTSVGTKGATVNLSKRGTTLTTGIPGSGLSHTQRFSGPSRASQGSADHQAGAPHPLATPYDQIFGKCFASGLAGAAVTLGIGFLLAPATTTAPTLRSAVLWITAGLAVAAFFWLFRRRRAALMALLGE